MPSSLQNIFRTVFARYAIGAASLTPVLPDKPTFIRQEVSGPPAPSLLFPATALLFQLLVLFAGAQVASLLEGEARFFRVF